MAIKKLPSAQRSQPSAFAAAVVVASLWASLVAGCADSARERVSSPGHYVGYSQAKYDGWIRMSQYVPSRDGTRLAVDYYQPTRGGVPATERLPVVWTFERYHRACFQNNAIVSAVDRDAGLQLLLRHGYVIAIADVRGTGASFGTWDGPFAKAEADDLFDVTEWLAKQPWSTGKVGMFGASYMGTNQLLAAAASPPALKAIMPEMAVWDLYAATHNGDVFHDDFVSNWSHLVTYMDTASDVARTDDDRSTGVLQRDAFRQHRGNRDTYKLCLALPDRDSKDPQTAEQVYVDRSPSSKANRINESHVAVYHVGGWMDLWSGETVDAFDSLRIPHKMVIGPWSHNDRSGFDLGVERLRWFDYWLKGIDNGIMAEPAVYYSCVGAPANDAWRFGKRWPTIDLEATRLYLSAGRTGTAASSNDGRLQRNDPGGRCWLDNYTVDYQATSGYKSRWAAGYGVNCKYGPMQQNDQRGLTYTSEPLTTSRCIEGYPQVRLVFRSDQQDVILFAYLEVVDPDGNSWYVSEGKIRKKLDATSVGSIDTSNRSTDQPGLTGTAVADIAMLPVSAMIRKGDRFRLTIACADRDNVSQFERSAPPNIIVFCGPQQKGSAILVPLFDPRERGRHPSTSNPSGPSRSLSLGTYVAPDSSSGNAVTVSNRREGLQE